MAKDAGRGWDWAGLPVIATVARLLCRELMLQNDYLRLENRIPKRKAPGRLLTDTLASPLASSAMGSLAARAVSELHTVGMR